MQQTELSSSEFAKVQAWFDKTCTKYRALWHSRIKQVQNESSHSRAEIARMFAENAKGDLQRFENEITTMLTRTGIIVAAATLLFAVFALRPDSGNTLAGKVSSAFLTAALFLTALAFIAAVIPLAPPFWRAWKTPYDKRAYVTLLVVDDFTSWVMSCWLSDRRTPVITAYKKAHSVAVRLLLLGAALIPPGLGASLLAG